MQGGGKDSITKTIGTIMNLAMKLEQEKALSAGPYERNEDRTGHRNGYKDKLLKTRMGEVPIQIPQVRGMEFYPGAVDKGCRSERALKLAIAQMYIQGVSTRRVSKIVEQLCGFEVSQSQVSNAARLLDEEIKKWRERPLDTYKYLVLDATYEKVRMDRSVVSGAVLIAYGIDITGQRRVLGISTEISEADVHWRRFLQSLVERGLHGVTMITSDAHSGLKAACEAIFPTVKWQRCQFHLQQNAGHHVTRQSMRKELAQDLRTVFNAPNLEEAQRYLKIAVDKYRADSPQLSEWLEHNVPESLTVFTIPVKHRRRLRTSNLAERQMKEIKRRTKVAMIFPNKESLNRIVAAIMMEVDETWATGKRYLDMETD
ncbi:IS256 family transposase [Spirochaeta lutea]|uniref:IS256 family transposase n=1 Tax=Spirochaeta lutea TaxID=1480694 RepID=UPI0038B4900C